MSRAAALSGCAALDQQRTTVASEAGKWGTEWIVFPNATYGTWSKAPLKAWDAEPVIEPW